MLLKIITIILSVMGVLGTFLPAVPGTPLILLAAIVYGWLTNFLIVKVKFILLLGAMSLIAEGSEYLASLLGARYFGASNYGIIAAICGAILTVIFLGPAGIFIGAIIGSVAGELIAGKKVKQAIKISIGSILGFISGTVISFIFAVVMTGLLLLKVF